VAPATGRQPDRPQPFGQPGRRLRSRVRRIGRDVTVAELAIESFFPADELTAEVLRSRRS
jgi:hypothetical protein